PRSLTAPRNSNPCRGTAGARGARPRSPGRRCCYVAGAAGEVPLLGPLVRRGELVRPRPRAANARVAADRTRRSLRSSRRRRLSAAHPGCRSNRPRHYGGEGLLRSSSSSWTPLFSSRDLRAGTAARSTRFNGSSRRLAGRDGDAGDNPDLVHQSEDEAAAAAAAAAEAGAAGGWQVWVNEAVAKVKEALPERSEAKKILPLGLMLFFILFDYTILRDTK
ncbi:unnamed protein product, partial [Ectocarpus sp. 13 AM-2016]